MNEGPEILWDENLHEAPSDPVALRRYIVLLEAQLQGTVEPDQRVSCLGEIGSYRRILGDLVTAEENIKEALGLIRVHQLGIRKEIQQKIRLAHVLQWKKDFDLSNPLFKEIIDVCRTNLEAQVYLDFALQHAGKNYFDQKEYGSALQFFEEALRLRKNKPASEYLVASTELAIARTKALMG